MKILTGGLEWDRCLGQARESKGGIADGIVRKRSRGGSREIFGVETVEDKSVEDFEDDIHCEGQ